MTPDLVLVSCLANQLACNSFHYKPPTDIVASARIASQKTHKPTITPLLCLQHTLASSSLVPRDTLALSTWFTSRLNPNITVLEGTLDDDALIREHASKSDIVISTAIGYHEPSMRAALAGLEEVSKQRPGNPPLYIHVSGYGHFNDRSMGERIPDYAAAAKYVDTTFSPNDVPEGNIVVGINKEIIAIGERKESPIKTMILFHSWVYGIGNGVQKITAALRPSFNFAKVAGHAVTLGRGLNQFSTIHVKDVANSMIAMIRGALDGTAGTGVQGLYFAGDEFETSPSVKQIQDEIGNVLYELGLVSTPGSQPISLTSPLAQTLPEPVLHIFSGNAYVIPEKLKKLGVEFVKTKKLTVL